MGPVINQSQRKVISTTPTKTLRVNKKVVKAESMENKVHYNVSRFTDYDMHLFKEGKHFRLYHILGAHLMEVDGKKGVYFAVWAPNADNVCVVGDFNEWNPEAHYLGARSDGSGVWEGFIAGIGKSTVYKYAVHTKWDGIVEKADPFAFHSEVPPKSASVVWDYDYDWKDQHWMQNRNENNSLNSPISVYEMHFGSWRRIVEEDNRSLTFEESADFLVDYLLKLGFTHVEFMPLQQHPFDGSWGYQLTGYFAPASKFGTPQEMMYLVERLHRAGIGVYLDWVPSHFPGDGHGLARFDGTALFEHEDNRKGWHPDWQSYIFNYGRNEVKSFLISSAAFWLDKYHMDGLRVDGVASMLYLDYSREEGQWIPNQYGGRENLEAIQFLQELNAEAYEKFPGIQMIAEESTAWGGVSRPVDTGGLGFGMKWNMGWMHDTLEYFEKDPIHRQYHQGDLTFSMLYCYTENFMLSLSHDEVVHGKGALAGKMPGDLWQQLANLRALYGYMYGHPGKKLLFMGAEMAQWAEWNYQSSIEWHLMDIDRHVGVWRWLQDLNHFYRDNPQMHCKDFDSSGFQWIDCGDAASSVLSFVRRGNDWQDDILVVCNFTPAVRQGYRVGVPHEGYWQELLNSDAQCYGGSGVGNGGGMFADYQDWNGRPFSLNLTLPPLSVSFFKKVSE